MTRFVIVGFFILVIAGGVGFGVASADSSDDVARLGAFGFDEKTNTATRSMPSDTLASADEASMLDERSVLSTAAQRSIDAGLKMVDACEEAERQRVQEENAKAVKRMESRKSMQGVTSATNEAGAPASAGAVEYDLPAVDWSVGESAFVTEWANRIDAYLSGSMLAGYGFAFAQAAWDNGVDPRWSPAISNTESGKGSVCFLPCNAWGWGSNAWPDWNTAIRAHVAGLAEGYGYSITPSAAYKYCPPGNMRWYEVTLEQMRLI